MKAYALKFGDGRKRIWEHNDYLCAVVKRDKFNDYIGSVNFGGNRAVLTMPSDDLEAVIDSVEWFADNPEWEPVC